MPTNTFSCLRERITLGRQVFKKSQVTTHMVQKLAESMVAMEVRVVLCFASTKFLNTTERGV